MERVGQTLEKTLLPFPTSRRNSSRDACKHVTDESRCRAGTDGAGPAGHDLDGRPNRSTPARAGDCRPEALCTVCGDPVAFVFMDNPTYLKITGKDPHWAALPCGACEQKRLIREQEERTAASARNRLNVLIADSMLRERFLDKTFANFLPFGKDREKQLYVLSVAKDFADDFDRHHQIGTWLLFMGHVGTGKSHLCAAVINQLVRAGRTALFTKAPRLLREIKETFHRDSEITQSEIIRRLGGLDLLVIDEVGIQFGTDTERMILYEILDLRYEAMRPVILTTNITDLRTLEQLLGERIIDRLFEGESKVVFFDWESHRRFERTATDPDRPPKSPAATIPAGGKNR